MKSNNLNTQTTQVAKSTYDTPATEVVQLQPKSMLLNGSVQATRSSYGDANGGSTNDIVWE